MLEPADRSAAGARIQAEVTGHSPPAATPIEESLRDFVYAEVWSRPGLDRRARYLVAIAGAVMAGSSDHILDGYLRGALAGGELSLSELREAALHVAVYGGWGRGAVLDAAVTRAAAETGQPPAELPPIRGQAWDPAERIATGQAEFVKAMTFAGGPPVTPFLEAITNFVFGEMWCRPGLDQRSRRFLTLVGVAESSSDTPIRSHIHAAMASGNCTPDEMQEFVLQYGIHAGWPKASVVQGAVFDMAKKVAAGLAWNG